MASETKHEDRLSTTQYATCTTGAKAAEHLPAEVTRAKEEEEPVAAVLAATETEAEA